MEALSPNRDSYRRVQSQASCEERSTADLDENVAWNEHDKTGDKCTCKSKHLIKWLKIMTVVSLIAILLAATAVTLVTLQWLWKERYPDTVTKDVAMCTCPPTGADDIEYVQVTSDDVTSGVTSETERCPDCRIRRDQTRAASLINPGGTTNRRHRCNRACRGEIDQLRISLNRIQSQNTAIHFQGFPPGSYGLGQDGAYKWWRPATWYDRMSGFYYNHTSGHVIILRSGLYFIYSQVEHPTTQNQAHSVMINSTVFLRCVKSVPPSGGHSPNDHSSCYLGGATALAPNDEVWIKSTHSRGQVQIGQESSYWGIIKIMDLPEVEQV